eukprot:ANDGO_05546.mRNA.1 hypothetical protein
MDGSIQLASAICGLVQPVAICGDLPEGCVRAIGQIPDPFRDDPWISCRSNLLASTECSLPDRVSTFQCVCFDDHAE